MVFLHMLNTVFYKDLKTHVNKRKIYKGIMMGMDFSEERKSRRCYVKLEDPAIEIKVYAEGKKNKSIRHQNFDQIVFDLHCGQK